MCVEDHLAVPAAQPVAAHGIVGKRALLAAVGSILGAFLSVKTMKRKCVSERHFDVH